MAYEGKSIDEIMKGVKAFGVKAQGASAGAQTPDSSGTNAQRQQGGISTVKPKMGQTQAPFGAMPSENSTLSTYNPDLNGKSIVERAREFTQARRDRSPLRRSGPTPFQQRKIDKQRERFRQSILDNAGAGPGKDISLRAALGAIAQFEGQQLGADTARRGQDIDADTADLDRQMRGEIASNRNRLDQRLGELRTEESALDRSSREMLQEQKLTQQSSQFDRSLAQDQEKVMIGQETDAARIAADLVKESGRDRRRREQTVSTLLSGSTETDAMGQKKSNRDLLQTYINDLNSLLETE